MKWRNGTEYSDSHSADLHWRWADSKKPIHQAQHISLGKLQLGVGVFKSINLEMIEWLDEAEPSLTTDDETKLQDEAEMIYPKLSSYMEKRSAAQLTFGEIVQGNRYAYIEGRRRSIAEQKEMGLLLMDKDAEIEALKGEVAKLQEELLYYSKTVAHLRTELRAINKDNSELQ